MILFEIYLLTRLNPLIGYLHLASLASLICVVVFAFMCAINSDQRYDSEKYFFKLAESKLRTSIISCTLLSLLSVVIPSQKDAVMIIGGYYATNSAQIRQLPENVLAATNAFLKEYAEPLKQEVTETVRELKK